MNFKVVTLGYFCVSLFCLNLTGCEKAKEETANAKIVIGTYSQPAPLDPLKTKETISTQLTGLLYNKLTSLNEEYQAVPKLAESWEIKENGLRWVLHLRKGVLFHDGKELGAEDVVFTYKRVKHLRATEFENLREIEERDRYTVEIALKKSNVGSLLYWFRIPIVSRQSYQEAGAIKPIGTGPFKLKEWMVNDRITFEANRDYFEGESDIRKIVVQVYTDYEALLSAFLRGEVDIPLLIKVADVRLLENNPKFQVLRTASPFYYTILFNLRDPLLKEKKMRQALCSAVNREELLGTISEGRGTLARSPFASPVWADTSGVEEYDPETAEGLLNGLGWKKDPADGLFKRDGRTLEFQLAYSSKDPLFKKIAHCLWLQFQRRGIKIELAPLEPRALLDRHLRPLKYQLAIFQLNTGTDPDFASRFFSAGQIGDWNLTGYVSNTVDSLFVLGRMISAARERKEIYRKIDRILSEEYPIVPLFFPSHFVVASSRVENLWYSKSENLLKSARYWKLKAKE